MVKWPSIDAAYIDEFGAIDPEIHTAAGQLWPQAAAFSLSTLVDAEAGVRLMVRAAAILTKRMRENPSEIKDVKGFLFQTFKRLVFAEMRKQRMRRELENEMLAAGGWEDEDVHRKILIEQIVQRMDPWSRDVFELLTLGHHYEDIGTLYGTKANVMRSKFSKKLKHLIEQLNAETHQARDRALRSVKGHE